MSQTGGHALWMDTTAEERRAAFKGDYDADALAVSQHFGIHAGTDILDFSQLHTVKPDSKRQIRPLRWQNREVFIDLCEDA